ncbi:MAG: A/G-specific adenine glycosylase [Saprospiraceae bacterium]
MPSFFARKLIQWHLDNPRPLPWSDGSRNPYHIWLSEVIMQQTRIDQGTAYYLKFVNTFPDIFSLANASPDHIMKLWQGLGYYTRARNLHAAAQQIVGQHDGKFPDTYEALLALPGVGSYSAAAIGSFAFLLPYVVVDGNVKRVIARFAGIPDSIDNTSTTELIREIAQGYMKGSSPDVFNQAIMNFGALVCKPSSPLCELCPLSKKCFAYQNDMIDVIPVRSKKKATRFRYFHFVVLHYCNKILLQQREGKEIWEGLYAPPLIETNSKRMPSRPRMNSFLSELIGHNNFSIIGSSEIKQQMLSHQTIIGRFHHFSLNTKPVKKFQTALWVTKKTAHEVGKPKLIVGMMDGAFEITAG